MNLDDASAVLADLLAGRAVGKSRLLRAIRTLEGVESAIDSQLLRDLRDVTAVLRKLAAGHAPIIDGVGRQQAAKVADAIGKLDAPDMYSLKFEKVSFDQPGGQRVAPSETMPEHLRKAQDASPISLLSPTVKWMRSLPADVRPQKLADAYPRVANLLAAAWPDPGVFRERLNEILFTDRTNRQGFPVEVAKELLRLNEHFVQRRNAVDTDIWRINDSI